MILMRMTVSITLALAMLCLSDYYPSRFEEGYTFTAAATILYGKPDHSSSVLIEIPAGELLEILEFTGETFTADSCDWGWYEAAYRLGELEYTGFILDRDLAFSHLSLGSGEVDTLFVYRLTGFDPEDCAFNGEASVVADGEILDSIDYRPCWTAWGRIFDYDLYSWLPDPSGFSDVRDLIGLAFYVDACGYECRDDLLAWTSDGRLIPGPQSSSISEAGLFHHWAEVILPSDSGGVAEQVTYHSFGEVYDEETDSWELIVDEITVYVWTGDGFEEKDAE
jgi:hypothetical protein